jgi:hypothetical protein
MYRTLACKAFDEMVPVPFLSLSIPCGGLESEACEKKKKKGTR